MAEDTIVQPGGGPPPPPNIQPNAGAAPPPSASPNLTGPPGAPATPPKETFGQGFKRGAGGEQYVVDAQGNITNARTSQTSVRGTFGSILAGAVMGAMAGARSSRPGGIPSHELRGGPEAGAAASDDINERDKRNRGRAQQDFQNRTAATEAKNKDLMYRADLHMKDLDAIHKAHEIGEAEQNDPLRHAQLVNAATASSLSLDAEVKNLGLINERTYKDYISVPKADIDKFHRQQVKLLTMPDGSIKVWDRTFDARTTPAPADFELKDLVGLDPKTGKPEWQVTGHVKAGAGTVAQLESEIDKERTQLSDAAGKNAVIEKEKATAEKEASQARLNDAQVKLMGSMGVNVPPGYKPPENLFKMDQQGAAKAITDSGTTVPPDFPTLYAIGHYDVDPKTLTTTPRKGMPTRDRNSGISYIRTFVNPNWDEKNYAAVQQLEKEFASTKSGSAGGNLMSFNTAIGHLGKLYEISQQLENGETPAWNTIANELSRQTGQKVKPEFDSIKGVLVGEAGRLMKQAAPDVEEMKNIGANLSSSNSPEQFKGVTNTFADAFLKKGEPALWKYYNYTGKLPPSTFDPNTIKTLQTLGIDASKSFPPGAQVSLGGTANQNPQQPTKPNEPPPARTGGAAVRDPNTKALIGYSYDGGKTMEQVKP